MAESTVGIGVSGESPGNAFAAWSSDVWALSASALPRLKYFDSPSATAEIQEAALSPSLCSNSTPFDGGQGTRSSPFLISSAAQLQNVHCNPEASFRLTSNIDMTGMSYSRPRNYSGQFDGAGHSISNLTIDREVGVWKTGLFDTLVGAVVKDLSVLNASVSGNYSVGVIAGHTERGSVVLRCRTSGTVNVLGGTINHDDGNQYDWGAGGGGGAVGSIWFSIVAESSSSVEVTADHRSGGLVGQGEPGAMIWDSYATGTLNCGEGSFCGSLAGLLLWNSTSANNYSIGNSWELLGAYDNDPVDSYMNPSASDTVNWDPAIWNLPASGFPTLK
ncbi:hypothetical protein EBZ37_13700 [bacterium]|nr:hypothetical protein [bacterium]